MLPLCFLITPLQLLYKNGQLLCLDRCAIDKMKRAWESEHGESSEEEWWAPALDGIRSNTTCACLSLIQFKILHRIGLVTVCAIYSTIEDRCDKCHASQCNLSYVFYLF